MLDINTLDLISIVKVLYHACVNIISYESISGCVVLLHCSFMNTVQCLDHSVINYATDLVNVDR